MEGVDFEGVNIFDCMVESWFWKESFCNKVWYDVDLFCRKVF